MSKRSKIVKALADRARLDRYDPIELWWPQKDGGNLEAELMFLGQAMSSGGWKFDGMKIRYMLVSKPRVIGSNLIMPNKEFLCS